MVMISIDFCLSPALMQFLHRGNIITIPGSGIFHIAAHLAAPSTNATDHVEQVDPCVASDHGAKHQSTGPVTTLGGVAKNRMTATTTLGRKALRLGDRASIGASAGGSCS